jgi:hypothetical protein
MEDLHEDGCMFLDEMTTVELKMRMLQAADRIEEEQRVMLGIGFRLAKKAGL